MARLAAEGIKAGALGFSTSRTLNHKTLDGRSIPTLDAAEAELAAIAGALRDIGKGWMQVISDFDDVEDEFAMLRRLVAVSRRPMAITMLQRDAKPEEWRRLAGWIADANAAGLPMLGQVLTRPTGILLGFEISQNPFVNRPSYQAIASLPFEQRIAILRQPDFRARLIAEIRRQPGHGAPRREVGSHLPARRSAGLRAAAGCVGRRDGGATGTRSGRGRVRPAAGAGRQGDPVSAAVQLQLRQSRHRARHADARRDDCRSRRWRRACRRAVRFERDQLHAHALDARPHARREGAAAVGDQAADARLRLGHRAGRSRCGRRRLQGRHQRDRLRSAAIASSPRWCTICRVAGAAWCSAPTALSPRSSPVCRCIATARRPGRCRAAWCAARHSDRACATRAQSPSRFCRNRRAVGYSGRIGAADQPDANLH